MKNIQQILVRDYISLVHEKAHKCKLEPSFFSKMETELSIIANTLDINTIQALLFSYIFIQNYRDDYTGYHEMSSFFGSHPLQILGYKEDIQDLCDKGLIKKYKSRDRITRLNHSDDAFIIQEKVFEAILAGKEIPTILPEKMETFSDLLEEISAKIQQTENRLYTLKELLIEAERLCNANSHLVLVQKINEEQLQTLDKIVFLELIWQSLHEERSVGLEKILKKIFKKNSERINYLHSYLNASNELIVKNLIHVTHPKGLNEASIGLTKKSIEFLNTQGLNISSVLDPYLNIIHFDNIEPVELIFDPKEISQLEMLKKLFLYQHFEATQGLLKSKNLSKGITILLHGESGTGKTELVKQIALKSKRKILKIEISETKSMWYGHTEKLVKEIFQSYQDLAKSEEHLPILFFNEADGLFSKRTDSGSSNVSKTENAVQNILLEELENFEGILFATTNLYKSFDQAFDRRFLFKIRFHAPSAGILSNIWKAKLPMLSKAECDYLAEKYSLTGGQISNVVRKKEIYEVVYQAKVKLYQIMEFCEEESLFQLNQSFH